MGTTLAYPIRFGARKANRARSAMCEAVGYRTKAINPGLTLGNFTRQQTDMHIACHYASSLIAST